MRFLRSRVRYVRRLIPLANLKTMCLSPFKIMSKLFYQKPVSQGQRHNAKRIFAFVLLFAIFLFVLVVIYITPSRFLHKNVNSVCIIPDLDPYDKEMMQYTWNPGPINCKKVPFLVYVDEKGFLMLNTSAQRQIGLDKVSCVISRIERKNGDDELHFQAEEKIDFPVYIPGDFFFVKCQDKNSKIVYENLHHHVDYKRVLKERSIANESFSKPSVLIFGIDSLSRLSAIRKLPKTMKYLEQNLGAFVFKGHNKVSERTLGNIMTILTGEKIYSKALPKIDAAKEYYDKFPFVWKDFASKGYTTMYSEDLPTLATFNYQSKGFLTQPTDHYSRPLYLAMSKGIPFHFFVSQGFLFLEDKNIHLKGTSSLCYGNKAKHLFLMDYYKQFVQAYKGKSKFAFSWLTEISEHDNASFLGRVDNDVSQFLRWLNDGGHLEKSFLIFMSDHGSRMQSLRSTVNGRIEVLMPLVTMVLPKEYRQKFPDMFENLRKNTGVLSTHYDLHETFKDILSQNFLPRSVSKPIPREISLFQRIPKTRSCSDAWVSEKFCACHVSEVVNTADATIKAIALFLVDKMNEKILPYKSKCPQFNLHTIRNAEVISSGLKLEYAFRHFIPEPKYEVAKNSLYRVTVEVIPGHAQYVGIVKILNGRILKLLGDISNTNPNDEVRHCIHDILIDQYCFCEI